MAAVSALNIVVPASDTVGGIIAVLVISDQTITAPTGWTVRRIGSISTFHYWLGSRAETAGDLGSTYTWTLGAATTNWAILQFSATGVTAVDGLTHNEQSNTTTLTANSITTSSANDLIVAYYVANQETGIAFPSLPVGFNPLEEGYSRGSLSNAFIIGTQPAVGAVGNISVTLDTTVNGAGLMIALSGSNIRLTDAEAASS